MARLALALPVAIGLAAPAAAAVEGRGTAPPPPLQLCLERLDRLVSTGSACGRRRCSSWRLVAWEG